MKTLREEIRIVEVGAPAQHGNLTVYPILRVVPEQPEPDYYLLEDAIGRGLARVTEVSLGGLGPRIEVREPERPACPAP